jgi:hypothetical protein
MRSDLYKPNSYVAFLIGIFFTCVITNTVNALASIKKQSEIFHGFYYYFLYSFLIKNLLPHKPLAGEGQKR